MNQVSVDAKRFLHIDGRKVQCKVLRDGRLEFCDKSREHRNSNTRYVRIHPDVLSKGIKKQCGEQPYQVEVV